MHVLILTFCLLQSIINANGINIDSLIIREDLDDRGKRYLPNTKIPYEGIVYKKYSSGEKELQGNLISGLQEGKWTWWYINGEVKSEVTFVNNLQHGPFKSYFQSGELQESGAYLKGNKEGLWTKYYESQKKLSETNYKYNILHGRFTHWHEPRKLLHQRYSHQYLTLQYYQHS